VYTIGDFGVNGIFLETQVDFSISAWHHSGVFHLASVKLKFQANEKAAHLFDSCA
jgi:hypothetical protein